MNGYVFVLLAFLSICGMGIFAFSVFFPKLIFLITNSDGNQYIVDQQPKQSPDYIFCPYPVKIENFNVQS